MGSFRVYLVVFAWISAALILANTALAEGRRNTYVEDVYTGFNSQTWNDRDQDKKKEKDTSEFFELSNQ
jgi:hypothetical protein